MDETLSRVPITLIFLDEKLVMKHMATGMIWVANHLAPLNGLFHILQEVGAK